jgi:phosphomannomutase
MNTAKTINQLMQESQVSFGTSGARGLVSNMTDEICYNYTTAFILHLIQSHQLGNSQTIGIAGDLRPSSPKIMNACAKAILDFKDVEFEVINCGFIASPAIALYGIEHNIATIMVTGSHIPDDRNGIKFNTPMGEILKTDEVQIRKQEVSSPDGLFDQSGMFTSLNNGLATKYLPEVNQVAQKHYIQRYIDFFPKQALLNLKIGVYQHSGVARDDMLSILKTLGAKVIPLNRSDIFIPVDTEAIRAEDYELAKQWVNEHHFDAIVSTDGDADRPLVSDEKGNWLRGDIIGILCAQYLGIKHVVTPVSCNTAVEKSQLFDSVSRTKIGSPYVIAQMNELLKTGKTAIAGYEANGGFLCADDVQMQNHTLKALPTRDAIIVILALLHMLKLKQQALSLLASNLPQRYTYSDRIKNIPTKISQQIIQNYLEKESGMSKIKSDFCGLFASLTDKSQKNNIHVKVKSIDNTDGLRIVFDNQNIIHFRPSGNAPEFRCYTEAGSITQATQINALCLEKIREIAQNIQQI